MSNVKILDCEQRSPEWYAARLGLVTASELHTVLAKGEGKTRRTYLLKLAGEAITGEPAQSYSNANMERGRVMEPEARAFYSFTKNVELTPVGFVVNEKHKAGCSPDSLIGDDGALEIKSMFPHLLIEVMIGGVVPPEYKPQLQGILWLAERDWIDLSIYWPKMPAFVKRAGRDEQYIARLAREVAEFNQELAALVKTLKKMGGAS